jgi:hypothetical protein
MLAVGQSVGVQAERVARLNKLPVRKGKYVLLWVQQDVRAEYNHALVRSLHRPLCWIKCLRFRLRKPNCTSIANRVVKCYSLPP